MNEGKKVPFLIMEDETAIEQLIEYDEKTYQVYSYCGKKEEGHRCEDHYPFKVCVIYGLIFQRKRTKKYVLNL